MVRWRTVREGLVLGAVAAVAGCAHPVASRNAGAEAMQAPPDTKLQTSPGVPELMAAVGGNRIVVPFPPASAQLGPAADRKLDVAARLFRDAHPVLMFVSGHSDPLGDEYANLLLSARRAQTVKRALVARGIPASRLLLQALGESEPVAGGETGDRRVVVTWRLL